MLKSFFIGLPNYILLRYMGWSVEWEAWRSKLYVLLSELSCLYFSPRMYTFGHYSVQYKEFGDLGSFCQICVWADSPSYFSSDPLVQWVTSWKKHELLLVIIIPSPFLECLWRHQTWAISVIKSSFVCSFYNCIQLIHGKERVVFFFPNMMPFLL